MTDMDNTQVQASQWLARSLANAGTSHVFFVDAVLRNTLVEFAAEGVECVLAHTEKAAAYMADGYARVSGRPGICMAQSVGAANLAAGLQDAWLHRSPVIALTGRKIESHQYRNAYQEIDHAPMYQAVTKMTAQVHTAADLPRLLRQAWRTALTGSPRPVHLDLAGLLAEVVETETVSEPVGDPVFEMKLPPHRPLADLTQVQLAAAAIRAARRPILVVGNGAAVSGAAAEVLQLAERLQAPIATSLGGYGLVPTTHRLAIGTIGTYGTPVTNRIVNEADLVIVIGSHLSDQITHTWRVPAQGTPIVQIELDPNEAGRNYPNTLALIGDPKATVARLVQELKDVEPDRAFADAAASAMTGWRESVQAKRQSGTRKIAVHRLCAEVSNALPDDGILVADTGHSGIWTCTLVDFNGTGQTYLRAGGSLGWAFPAALGAKCAAPERKVICFTGDGGFYYHLPELETARRRGIPVVVVINNNSGFGQGWVNLSKQGRTPQQMHDIVCFEPTDFAAIANSFGLEGIRVEDPADLPAALQRALNSDHTVVIDVVTDIADLPPQPWGPV
jgi:acetolactate synthase-1/2/3 large subunit